MQGRTQGNLCEAALSLCRLLQVCTCLMTCAALAQSSVGPVSGQTSIQSKLDDGIHALPNSLWQTRSCAFGMPTAYSQEGPAAISMTPTLPCPHPQSCHAYKFRLLASLLSPHSAGHPFKDTQLCAPCPTTPVQTVSSCESCGLCESLCTPSKTPRQPPLLLLHPIVKPLESAVSSRW